MLDGGVVEPWAVATLPLDAADHAEFGLAAARHVVAALLQLDHGGAVEAALPALLLGDLCEARCGFVFRALATRVPAAVTRRADFCFATRTAAIFAAGVGPGRVGVDVRGLDPLATAFGGAVDAVVGGVFLVFLVPLHLELQVKELLDVLQGDMVAGAASRRHVRRVGYRHGEYATEAGVAHAVAAGQFSGSGDGDVVRHASEAIHPGNASV